MRIGSSWRNGGQLVLILSLFWLLATAPNGRVTAANATLYELFLESCKGVVIRYSLTPPIQKILPYSKVNKTQPYKFEAGIDLINAGYTELQGWEMFIGFQYHEIIAGAPGVSFVDGSSTPGVPAGNGTSLVGLDTPDLLTSIDTAQDLSLIAAKFTLTGTEFGVGPGQPIKYPLPDNISLSNPGYSCQTPLLDGNTTMLVCCPENSSVVLKGVPYLPRYAGDITMYYDIIQTVDNYYEAKVTINMEDPIGMLNHWNLTWDWAHGEFIYSMKGAQTLEQEQDDCVNGPAGVQYTTLDFSVAMCCQKTPSIVDMNQYRKVDQNLPGCCRNGTLLPSVLDPDQTKSVFELQVYKLKPNLKRKIVHPPYNWRIGNIMGDVSPYVCGKPRLVSPSEHFTDGLHYDSAVKSWQVTCNQTVIPKKAPHKCCVSFSAYYNSSVVPCPTCACGCQNATMEPGNMKCDRNPYAEAMLLPSYALLLPPSNRTILASALAKMEHYPQPDPMPCPDNCGVSINWHIYSDYAKGFSARITLFNWNPLPVNPWSVAIEFTNATAGYENVYSFNGSKIVGYDKDPNRTLIYMHGKDGYNAELIGLDKGLVPGKLQSLLSFDKRKTPGIDVVNGGGFPERVWFNGDECELPDIFPKSSVWRTVQSYPVMIVTMVFALMGLLGGL